MWLDWKNDITWRMSDEMNSYSGRVKITLQIRIVYQRSPPADELNRRRLSAVMRFKDLSMSARFRRATGNSRARDFAHMREVLVVGGAPEVSEVARILAGCNPCLRIRTAPSWTAASLDPEPGI